MAISISNVNVKILDNLENINKVGVDTLVYEGKYCTNNKKW